MEHPAPDSSDILGLPSEHLADLTAAAAAALTAGPSGMDDVVRTLASSCPDIDDAHLALALCLAASIDAAARRLEHAHTDADHGTTSVWLLALTESSLDTIRDALPVPARGPFLTAGLELIDTRFGTTECLPHWRPTVRDAVCLPRSHEVTDDGDEIAPYPFELADVPAAVFELVLLAELAVTGDLAVLDDAALVRPDHDPLSSIPALGSRRALPALAQWLFHELDELAGPAGDPLDELRSLIARP